MITADTIWVSNIHPDSIHEHKIRDLNSEHVANILHFFKTTNAHGHSEEESAEIIRAMNDEASRRELTPEFLSGAPYPYDYKLPYTEYHP